MADKIIVSQIGARHRYAIPRALEKQGLLYRLYTDSTSSSFLGRIAGFLSKCGFLSSSINRLCNRTPKVSETKLYSSDKLFIKSFLYKLLHKDSLQRQLLVFDGLSDRCIKWGVSEADCVYGMYFENFKFLQYAKSKGLKVVVDIYERPMTYKLLIDEIKGNKEYSVFLPLVPMYEDKHKIRMKYIEDLLALADFYTVPSMNVAKSLKQFANFEEQKVCYMPYASSIVPSSYNWKPRKHRILFVGSDVVNKGVLYCARAATELKKTYPDLDFRIVGLSRNENTQSPVFDDLNFVGFVNKKQLEAEYCSAEALVFPTLFEGFAGAVIEAASCGCPIITTENAGTDLNEFPAIYILEKNSDAIVEAVVNIFENKENRDSLSKRVFEYSRKFTPAEYERRLVDCLSKI